MPDLLDKPERAAPLSHQVAQSLRERISSGKWPLGTRIPPETSLATAFGISRNTVREALRSLVHSGLLEARAGDGTYVRATSELEVQLRKRVDPGRLDELFEVRGLLERHASRAAAERATAADHVAMTEALERRDRAADPEQYIAHDAAFHQAVVDAAGNTLLAELYANLDAVAIQLATLDPDSQRLEDFRATVEPADSGHHDLLRAILTRDAESADRISGNLIARARSIHDLPPSP